MNEKSMNEKMYTTFCTDFGLKPEWLGKTVTDEKGKTFTISGLNPRSKKFPVLTKEGMQFNAEYVAALFTGTVDKLEAKRKKAHEKKTAAMLKKARAAFSSVPSYHGVPPSWLDKTFRHGRRTFTLIGYTDEKLNFPFVARAADGKVLFFTSDYIREAVGGKKSVAA
jgi:hypothetical protein